MTRNKKGTEKEMRMDGEQGKSPKKSETYISTLRTFLQGNKTRIKRKQKEHENPRRHWKMNENGWRARQKP